MSEKIPQTKHLKLLHKYNKHHFIWMFISKILKTAKEKDIKIGVGEQERSSPGSIHWEWDPEPYIFKQLRDRILCVNTQSGVGWMELRPMHVARSLEETLSGKGRLKKKTVGQKMEKISQVEVSELVLRWEKVFTKNL